MAISSSGAEEAPAAVEHTRSWQATYSAAAEVQVWRLLVLVAFTAAIWISFHFLTDHVFITPRNLSNLTVQGCYKIANASRSHSTTVTLCVALVVLAAVSWLLAVLRRRQGDRDEPTSRLALRPVTLIALVVTAVIFGVFFWTYASFNGL